MTNGVDLDQTLRYAASCMYLGSIGCSGVSRFNTVMAI